MSRITAWLIWTIGAAIAALAFRNPLHTALIALSGGLVLATLRPRSKLGARWHIPLMTSLAVWALAVVLYALLIHEGVRVIFRLPEDWLLVGGVITLEALLQGLALGLRLWTLMLLFVCLDVASSPPSIASPVDIVAEALGDTRATDVVPVRGIHGRGIISLGLVVLLWADISRLYLPEQIFVADALVVLGLALLADALFWVATRAQEAARQLPSSAGGEPVRKASILAALVGAAVSLGTLVLFLLDPATLRFDPVGSGLRLLAFDQWIGLLLALLSLPGVVMLSGHSWERLGSGEPPSR